MHKNWTREEHILAFNLYNRLPFGKINKSNPEVIKLATLIGRTPSSVGMKLGNFGRLDPALKARGISGLKNGAKGEIEVWEEFKESPEDLVYESEKLRAERLNIDIIQSTEIKTEDLDILGKDREVLIKQRVNQSFFRRRVLTAYDNKCCVTGLAIPQLLVAGHIIPWSQDISQRLNPQNGLCLNMLHDKAFDRGLMWIDDKFVIHYTADFKEQNRDNSDAFQWLAKFDGEKLVLPSNFKPSKAFLKRHAVGAWR